MRTNRIAFAVVSLVVLVAFTASLLKIHLAYAQTDASSTDASMTEPAPDAASVSTSSSSSTDAAGQTTDTSPPTSSAPGPSPATLTLVHAAGTKYIDYCTDGTTITAYPGDPAVAANFDEPDAPIPHCPDGQTWHHTSGMPGFDTPSGDLEVGQYALVGGAFTVHYPATTYTDATSTVEWPARIVTGLATDPVTGEAAPTSELPATEPAPAATTEGASSSTPSAEPSNDNSPSAPDTATSTDGSVPGPDPEVGT